MNVLYLVHNVADAAVRRRVELLEQTGARVALAGFHRDAAPPVQVASAPVTALGHTADGALAARALSVLRHWLRPRRLRTLTARRDVIVARNLETLVLARRARRQGQRLVYECLDIHRLLLARGPAGRLLRAIESWALRGVDLVVVSAPAFRDAYFRTFRGYGGPIALVENKVPSAGDDASAAAPPVPAGPWVIGWFGMLRCRRTFDTLARLAARSDGHITVLIAGRPSPDVFADLPAEAGAAPGVRFAGAYTASDLPGLLAQVHFVWAIDWFEEGLNSAWLLPNRLYESLAHGAVPLALRGVETGRWLARQGAGVLLDDPERDLPALLSSLDTAGYAALRRAVAAVPRAAVVMDRAAARAVGRTILGLPSGDGALPCPC